MKVSSYLKYCPKKILYLLFFSALFLPKQLWSQLNTNAFISQTQMTFEDPGKYLQLLKSGDSLVIAGFKAIGSNGYMSVNGEWSNWTGFDSINEFQLFKGSTDTLWALEKSSDHLITIHMKSGPDWIPFKSYQMPNHFEIQASLSNRKILVVAGKETLVSGDERGFVLIEQKNNPTGARFLNHSLFQPTSISHHTDTSFYVLGQYRESPQDQWNKKFFIGELTQSGNFLFQKISYEINEVYMRASYWDPDGGQLFFTGELQDSSTMKRDIFVATLNPSSNTLGNVAQLGEANFDFSYDILGTEDSSIVILGSSEFSGNGIDHPLIIKMPKNLSAYRAEIGLWELFSSRFEAGYLNGNELFFTGNKRTNTGDHVGIYGMADLSTPNWLCDGHAASLHIKKIQFPSNIGNLNLNSTTLAPIQAMVLSKKEEVHTDALLCIGDTCPDSLTISVMPPKICRGETISLSAKPSFPVDWYLNNQYIGSGTDLELEIEEAGTHSISISLRNSICKVSGNSRLEVFPTPIAELLGPGLICPGDQEKEYQFLSEDQTDIHLNVFGGTILDLGTSSCRVKWENEGMIILNSTNSLGCQNSDSITVLIDSLVPEPPAIEMISWDRDSILCQIRSRYSGDLIEKEIFYEIKGFWNSGQIFENSGPYRIFPQEEPEEGVRVQLRGKDHCRVDFRSKTHKTIFLRSELDASGLNRLYWEEYEGWNKEPEYSWKQTQPIEELFDPILPGEALIPYIAPNLISCFAIIARNGELESLSNETCILEGSEVFISNLVTPNGDGENDQLKVITDLDLRDLSWIITNRWGKVVERFEGDPEKVDYSYYQPGTYYYEVQNRSGDSWKGWFQVLR